MVAADSEVLEKAILFASNYNNLSKKYYAINHCATSDEQEPFC